MTQLPLPLAWPEDPADDEFLISSSNARAAEHLRRWGTWPVMASLLVGPRKSGRTLLARLFARQSGGAFVDDAEQADETAIFHAWNLAQQNRKPLLIVADAPPPAWKIRLPDLRSRVLASPVARIEEPDETLIEALLTRAFLRRGLDARPDLLQWLVPRLERSHIAITRAVDILDHAALAGRRRLSIPLARDSMAAAGMIPRRRSESGETSA